MNIKLTQFFDKDDAFQKLILINIQWKSNHSDHNKTKARLNELVTKMAGLPVPNVLHSG